MIRCVAIDDEPRALEVVKNHISRVPFLELEGTFLDPFEGINFINEQEIDLVFLDIDMPDINGFKLIKHLTKKPLIIFTTAHEEYALDSYEVEALDYLLKPFDFSRFLIAANKAKERMTPKPSKQKEFFFVNTGHQKQRIFYKDILYIEGEGNYVNYVTPSGKFLVRATIKETLKLLPARQFFQVHRSFIVALAQIDKIEDNHVVIGAKKISIGGTYRDPFFEAIDIT